MSEAPDIPIQPKSWIQSAVNLRVYITSYQLKTSATILAQLLDIEGKIIKKETLVLEGTEFLNWGFDDSYVINWVCSKLGLQRVV